MAEITRRRTGELLRELFNILMAAPDGVQASAALQALASRVTLTPYEADCYESGGRRFEKIVRFATVDFVKAGWLVKDKGIWAIPRKAVRPIWSFPTPKRFTDGRASSTLSGRLGSLMLKWDRPLDRVRKSTSRIQLPNQ